MVRTSLLAVFLRCLFLFHLGLGSVSLLAPAAGAADRVGPQAVWKPAPDVITKLRTDCSADPAKLGDCFLKAMQSGGASTQAVAFAKSLADKGYGYLRAFRNTGHVDIAYVEYVFRANEMEGVLLVNGEPALIDVDDAQYASQTDLQKNPTYAEVLQKYPKASVFPADRNGTGGLTAIVSPHGQQFLVEYRLRDGCHACAQIGTEVVAFQFDDSGRLSGTKVVGVRPGSGRGRR